MEPGKPDNASPPTADNTGNNKSVVIHVIGISIIVLSAILLILLILIASKYLDSPADSKSYERAKELLSVLLPVIGTWMGTILAFYFSRENFESANRNVAAMVSQVTAIDQKLEEQKVSDVMMKPDMMSLLKFENEEKFKDENLNTLITKMDEMYTERLVVLEKETMKFIILIYRQTIERFLLGYSNGTIKLKSGDKADKKPANQLTVRDMFDSEYPVIKQVLDLKPENCFVAETATLEQVRQLMQDNNICQDVFVTKTGNKDEPVLGWITNNLVVEKAELFKKAGRKS